MGDDVGYLKNQGAEFRLCYPSVDINTMQEPEGGTYAVPMNYAWDGESSIYMHSAPEGHKLRCPATCPRVALVIIGAVEVLSHILKNPRRWLPTGMGKSGMCSLNQLGLYVRAAMTAGMVSKRSSSAEGSM